MATTIRQLIERGETDNSEFKTSLSDSRRIIETIAALATRGGGTVLVGLRDDGTLVGVNLGAGALERFVQQVLAGTDPTVYIDATTHEVDGLTLLRVDVPPGDGPHLAFGRAFYRSGPTTVAMGRDEYERRLLDRLRESAGFERRIDLDSSARIDPERVQAFRAAAGDGLPDFDDETLLTRLHLRRDNQLTVGGILLFGDNPQGPLPQACIRARATRSTHRDAMSVDGSLLEQIEAAVGFVARNTRQDWDRFGVRRVTVPELPRAAVREVITNAIAHRDYRSTAPVQLTLDDETLVIWNAGHLPAPLTPSALRKEHPSVPPNPLVARALHLAGYIEEWGTGTTRVIAALEEAGNASPTFEEALGGIRVTLPLHGAADRLDDRQHALLAALTEPRTSSELARVLSVSVRTVQGELKALEQQGRVARTGRGRATRWQRA